MNKYILSILVCLILSACGQKGPLIVKQPVYLEGQEIDDEFGEGAAGNEIGSTLNNQIDGKPIIIYR